MTLTGKNLEILQSALRRSLEAVHADGGHLLETDWRAREALAYEATKYRSMLARVDAAVKKEAK